MEKIKYELDPYNRFVINKQGKRSGLRKFRKVIDGKFKLDSKNNLAYHIKSPTLKDEKIPNQINLQGRWTLTKDHSLRFLIDKKQRETFGNSLTLKGEILDAKENSIFFSANTKRKDLTKSVYTLNLKGKWSVDRYNRLIFNVRKGANNYDAILFRGAWKISKKHNIVYEYKKPAPQSKVKSIGIFGFINR